MNLISVVGPKSAGASSHPVFELPKYSGGTAIHFGNVTGLTGTLSASWDNGTTYADIPSILNETPVAAGETITATDDATLYFNAYGASRVKFTRTAGSGPLKLVSGGDPADSLAQLIASLLDRDLARPKAANPNRYRFRAATGDTTVGVTVLDINGNTLDTFQSTILSASSRSLAQLFANASGGARTVPDGIEAVGFVWAANNLYYNTGNDPNTGAAISGLDVSTTNSTVWEPSSNWWFGNIG